MTCINGLSNVELIGRNSNLANLSNKWSDLRRLIQESPPRPHLSVQDVRESRSKRFLTAQDTADIVARYEVGDTTEEIGADLRISKTRVAKILREQGITIRRQGLNDEQVREAATLYVAGKSLAWLGARFGVSHTTIAAALRREGIHRRPRPG